MIDDMTLEQAHHELMFYTLEHAQHDPTFIHQLVVDASAAQHAGEQSKNITVAFALIGLYLHIEKGYTGKQVQDAHVSLAKKRKDWPHFPLPATRGEVTVFDVLAAPAGKVRDQKIEEWCMSVWDAWHECHEAVRQLVDDDLL